MKRGWLASVVAVAAVAIACTAPGTPPTGGGTTTTATPTSVTPTTVATVPNSPVIGSFVVSAGPSPAPALLAFAWSVSDPNGDSLTCRLDANGDGNFDLTVSACQGTGSRNRAFPTALSATAVLEVSDGVRVTFASAAVNVTAGVSETFDIVVRPVAALDPTVQAAFDAAEAKWESVLTRGISDRTLNLGANFCVSGAAPITTVDDLVIDASIAPIDGVGNVLGQAGPCAIGGGDYLTRVGLMKFDSADTTNMVLNGTLDDVILHEMGHVLGIGTLWDYQRNLLSGEGTSDPRFVGARAVAEWDVLGGNNNVPVESGGGAGTADAHWRESTFDRELMTGYIDITGNYLSAMSIASLADLGYQVDLGAADSYTLPFGSFARGDSWVPLPGVMTRPDPTTI